MQSDVQFFCQVESVSELCGRLLHFPQQSPEDSSETLLVYFGETRVN